MSEHNHPEHSLRYVKSQQQQLLVEDGMEEFEAALATLEEESASQQAMIRLYTMAGNSHLVRAYLR